jgi:pyruvate dehydrogenase E2 component (dihydrolipoamide acetyltransferase)
MKVEVVMPKMGESLQEGTITKWLKKEGDKVERDEMLLEISTDKVDTEVPSPVTGILAQLVGKENETIEVGKVIAYIETEEIASSVAVPSNIVEETIPEPVAEVIPQKVTETISSSGNLVDVVMPKMGESLQEGTITKWLKMPGDKIERDEMLLEISTDKVDTEVPAPVSGILFEVLAKEGDVIEVGKPIARISTEEVAVTPKKEGKLATEPIQKPETIKKEVPVGSTTEIPRTTGKRFYSPLVKTIAKEYNITLEELETISGSGLEGRVNKTDILNFIEKKKSGKLDIPQHQFPKSSPVAMQTVKPSAQTQVEKTESQVVSKVGKDSEIIPMDRLRTLIAEHMIYSQDTSAHVTSVDEADLSAIVKFREKFKDEFFKQEGFNLTYTPFFVKAVTEAIQDYPTVNVSVDGKNIILHKKMNIGIATALPDGNLIVPVIKNADALSLRGLARAVNELSSKARTKKLNPDDIQDGTFSITNFGVFGTLFGTPIINQPQTAILGVGAIKKQPVVRKVDDEYLIVIRDICYLSLSFDHRVIDGMLAGQFLRALIKHLEAMNESNLDL